ncbi:MAG: hypothetical protein JRF33_26865, partial [Deltaproteobacteria bacterium]|nr:hypothetical protein [Deltaproteobacteria bacterium]
MERHRRHHRLDHLAHARVPMSDESTRDELLKKIVSLESEAADARRLIDELYSSRHYLSAILNNTDLPIYLKTADFKYILVNR